MKIIKDRTKEQPKPYVDLSFGMFECGSCKSQFEVDNNSDWESIKPRPSILAYVVGQQSDRFVGKCPVCDAQATIHRLRWQRTWFLGPYEWQRRS